MSIRTRSIVLVLVLAGCAAPSDAAFEDVPPDVIAQSLELAATTTSIPQCPGMTSGIASYDGFGGSYSRATLPADGEISTLTVRTLTARPGSIAVTGSWSGLVRRGVLSRLESGTYEAIPDNPAIGPLITLTTTLPAPSSTPSHYFVLGSHRNVFGRIDQLCLLASGQPGETRTPFPLRRIGL